MNLTGHDSWRDALSFTDTQFPCVSVKERKGDGQKNSMYIDLFMISIVTYDLCMSVHILH